MTVKTAKQEKSKFNERVDREFYDEVKQENGGTLPADLLDANGHPRRLTKSPADQAYRKMWIAIAAAMRGSKAVPGKSIKAVCIPCALKAAKIPPLFLPSKDLGKPIQVGGIPTPTQPRKIATSHNAPIPCKFISSTITCSHGRQALNGVLCVVPDSYGSIGDQIACSAVLEGGCGSHIEWTVAGMWTSTEHGSSTKFLAKTFKPALLEGWLGLHHIEPQTYDVQAVACEGDAPSASIRAYPPDKWGGKIDFEEIRKKIKQWLSHVPIDEDEKEKLEKGWFVGALEYSQQWKEDRKSNLAFCESVVSGSFDPLFGAKLPPVPIYPLNIVPAPLQKWLKAGVYFSLEGGFGLKVELMWNYWAEKDKSEYEKTEVSLLGRITGKLSVNLYVVDKDVLNAEVSGATGLKAFGKYVAESTPAVEFGVQWTGLEAAVSIKVAWGWVEYNRTYPLVKESDLTSYKHSFGSGGEAGAQD